MSAEPTLTAGFRSNLLLLNGNLIQDQFFVITDYPTASALSVMLMLVILVMVTIYVRKAGTEELV